MYFLCRGTARPLCEATTSVLPLFFAACARTQPLTAVRIRTRSGNTHAVSRARHRGRVCVPALLCVTRIIRALAPGRGVLPLRR